MNNEIATSFLRAPRNDAAFSSVISTPPSTPLHTTLEMTVFFSFLGYLIFDMNVKEGITICKDILFPIFCVGCDAEGVWVCDSCLETIDVNGFFACPLCQQETGDGVACQQCHPVSALEQVTAMSPYDAQSVLGHLIHALKYSYATDCLPILHDRITLFLKQHPLIFQYIDGIVPVPLHRRRYAERGFNQAAHIAHHLSAQLDIPMFDIMQRRQYTAPQATQNREQRLSQMEGVFACADSAAIHNQNILLIDDVYTTGATLHHCALALEKAGAAAVSAFVLARG